MTNSRNTNTSTVGIQVPSGTAPGDPVVIGGIRGFAEAVFDSNGVPVANTLDGNGFATVRVPPSSVIAASVIATTDSTGSVLGGASAVAPGDTLYKTDSAELISKDSSGTKQLGYALGTRNSLGFYPTSTAISAGLTATIDLILG